jgi:hypothetical protein
MLIALRMGADYCSIWGAHRNWASGGTGTGKYTTHQPLVPGKGSGCRRAGTAHARIRG